MSNYVQRCVWRLMVLSATGAAFAALVRAAGRGRRRARLSASRSMETTATEAALQMAGGAMSNEGGPVRNS
jgi:hypothetical protein